MKGLKKTKGRKPKGTQLICLLLESMSCVTFVVVGPPFVGTPVVFPVVPVVFSQSQSAWYLSFPLPDSLPLCCHNISCTSAFPAYSTSVDLAPENPISIRFSSVPTAISKFWSELEVLWSTRIDSVLWLMTPSPVSRCLPE